MSEWEAARLFEQGIEQYQIGQIREALQSWKNALQIYRELKGTSINYLVEKNDPDIKGYSQ